MLFYAITLSNILIVLIDKFYKLTHLLWRCHAVNLRILVNLDPHNTKLLIGKNFIFGSSDWVRLPRKWNLQISDLREPIFLPIFAILCFALRYATICALWEFVSWPIVLNKNKWVSTKKYKPEQQDNNPYPDMGILGINIFGQGIQIFLSAIA